jgi:hypothetical protein
VSGGEVFGPFSRFSLRPIYLGGALVAHDLYDAEIEGDVAQNIGRHKYASDAFADAALRVRPEWQEQTASGQRFIPA